MFDVNDFLQRLSEDYNFIENTPRNQNRTANVLQYLGGIVREIFVGGSYTVSAPVRRPTTGRYFDKQFPIIVKKDNNVVFVMTCHVVASSLKKNAINNFEHMMGVSANVPSNVKYCNIQIFQNRVPVRNTQGAIRKWDFLSDGDLIKYVNLYDAPEAAHKPYAFGVFVIETPVAGQHFSLANLNGIPENITSRIFGDLSIQNTLSKISALRQQLGD